MHVLPYLNYREHNFAIKTRILNNHTYIQVLSTQARSRSNKEEICQQKYLMIVKSSFQFEFAMVMKWYFDNISNHISMAIYACGKPLLNCVCATTLHWRRTSFLHFLITSVFQNNAWNFTFPFTLLHFLLEETWKIFFPSNW